MHMKTKTKASGFFIVEILIVLLIVGILAIALLPNLQLYVQKAKFSDNISAAAALKPAVEFCLLQNRSDTTVCDGGASGIPTNVSSDYGGASGNVNSTAVASGAITVTSEDKFGAAGDANYTYILTPAFVTGSQAIEWTKSGTCDAEGLC